MSRTTCLQGEPGSGKSKMACETAVNKPVYAQDIDCKLRSAEWAQALIKSGELIIWEVSEPVDSTNLMSRITSLTKNITNKGPLVRPKGFSLWGEQFYRLPDICKVTPFGTVLIDSLTLLNEHLKAMIMYDAGRSKFTFDQWNALKIGWMDTFSFMRDMCREQGWDLITTVHERFKEEPGDRTTGASMEVVTSGDDKSYQKVYKGTQDVKVWASIDGAFGDLIGAHCDEYYHLYVDTEDKNKPKWRCRIHPDGRRSLRTSFKHNEAVHDPDFKQIWK